MANVLCNLLFLAFYLLSCISHLSLAQPYKAVSLGNWLVTEGWMDPSLFDGIPNKDLLDGTRVNLWSTKLQTYICSENGGGGDVVVNRAVAADWETFSLWRINNTHFSFRAINKPFIGLSSQGTKIDARSLTSGNSQAFQIMRNRNDRYRIRLRAANGQFLQVRSDTLITADYGGYGWDDDNPSVFMLTIVKTIQGEYQLTNGYGPDQAPEIMEDHWNTYITEQDFKFISTTGLDAVRIPVGWWIADDPEPQRPFVGGSLKALDNAFIWSQKYGLKVIIDLHAAPGSQNGYEDSASREGLIEWGDSSIQDTVIVIDFLAKRYARRPNLAAIGLLNKPLASGVSLSTLQKYYKQGYDAVRRYSLSAYVILSNRLGAADPRELLPFAKNLDRVVIEVHYYNLYSDTFTKMNAQQNIDYIFNQRSSDLRAITTSGGPLSFVGEWSAEWNVVGASKKDYHKFADAQLEVYGDATFGWAYWAYKADKNHWNFHWMTDNGYIELV